jgi:hypothetical protein
MRDGDDARELEVGLPRSRHGSGAPSRYRPEIVKLNSGRVQAASANGVTVIRQCAPPRCIRRFW